MPWVFAMSCYASLLGHPWVSKCRFLSWQIAWIRPQPMREDDTHKTPSVIDWFITHMMWHITTVSRCYGCVCVTYKKLWNSDYSVTTPEVLAYEFVHVSYFEPIRRSAGIILPLPAHVSRCRDLSIRLKISTVYLVFGKSGDQQNEYTVVISNSYNVQHGTTKKQTGRPQVFDCHFRSTDDTKLQTHHDVIKLKHFPCYWPFVRGNHRSPVDFPHKVQYRGALMFSLICAWSNGWANNR